MTNQPIVAAKVQALLFDAYGTLFDVHSIVHSIGHSITGDLEELSQLWRQKQLEITWLRALMERYEDFWSVTEAARRWAVKQLSIEMTDPQINMLMQAYLAPATFVDVSTALEAFNGSWQSSRTARRKCWTLQCVATDWVPTLPKSSR